MHEQDKMHIRKPRLRITKKGLKLTKPSVRIDGKTGVNISGQGVTGSERTKACSYNTKRGCSLHLFGIFLLLLGLGLWGCSSSATPETRAIVIDTLPANTAITEPTSTESPPTNTPVPTETPVPTDTPEPPTQTSTPTDSQLPTATAESSPTITLLPTDTPQPTAIPILSSGKVEITDIFFNGSGDKEPDEYVMITNKDVSSIQMQGWTLSDKADHVFFFTAFTLQPDQSCRVYTNEDHPESCGFNYRFDGSAIWNNGGDTATLRDSAGALIDTYQY